MTLRARFLYPPTMPTPAPTTVATPATFARGGGGKTSLKTKARKSKLGGGKGKGKGAGKAGGCGANAAGGGGFQKGNTCRHGGGSKISGARTVNRMVAKSKAAAQGKAQANRRAEDLAAKGGKPAADQGRARAVGRMVAKSKGAAGARAAKASPSRAEVAAPARAKAIGRMVAKSKAAAEEKGYAARAKAAIAARKAEGAKPKAKPKAKAKAKATAKPARTEAAKATPKSAEAKAPTAAPIHAPKPTPESPVIAGKPMAARRRELDHAFDASPGAKDNFVKISELRKRMPELTADEFKAVINKARDEGKISLHSHEGLNGPMSAEARAAAIHEAGSLLVYAEKREGYDR